MHNTEAHEVKNFAAVGIPSPNKDSQKPNPWEILNFEMQWTTTKIEFRSEPGFVSPSLGEFPTNSFPRTKSYTTPSKIPRKRVSQSPPTRKLDHFINKRHI